MIRLLRSNLSRMVMSKSFLIYLGMYALYSIALPIFIYFNNPLILKEAGAESVLAMNYGLASFPLQGLAIARLTSVIIGADFQNGTIRNKIIIGHSRTQIYIANLLTSIIISLSLNAAFLLFFFAISLPMFGGFAIPAKTVVWMLIDGTLIWCAYSAISTLITMVSKNTTVAIIISFALIMMGMMLVAYMNGLLSQQPMIRTVIINEAGEMIEKWIENPRMPSETTRSFCRFMLDFLPGGQSNQLVSTKDFHTWQMALYSLGIIGATSGAGILAFNKTNIK